MDAQKVTLRKMTPSEYDAATEHREAEMAREPGKLMPTDLTRMRLEPGATHRWPLASHSPVSPSMSSRAMSR